MADVAKLAGVSKMTVSKVIREVGNVSIETRQRVRQAIEDTGYMPNRIAGSLSTKTNPMVAVVVPTLSGNTFGEALRGIETVLSVAGLQTLVGATGYDSETEEKLIENLLSWQPSGLILTSGNEHNDKTRRLLESRPCPIVEIWDVDYALFDAKVGFSHRNAGRMMAEHLLERGRRNFGFVGSRLNKDLCAAGRYGGFRERLARDGLPLEAVLMDDGPRGVQDGIEGTRQLLERRGTIDAIYFINDLMAVGGLTYLHRNNVPVPDQIAIAGFNGTVKGSLISRELTSCVVPGWELGEAAARTLLDLLEGKITEKIFLIDLELSRGDTT